MTFLREWIMSLCGVAVVSVIAMGLTPRGRVRSITKLVCGIVAIIALIKPVAGFDFGAYSMNLAQYREAMAGREEKLQNTNERLLRAIIEEECAAYILDKAQVLSVDTELVAVTAKWGDEGFWYPYEVRLELRSGEGERERLAALIEAELGIPRERQYWSEDEGDG